MSLEALERFGKVVADDTGLQEAIQAGLDRGDDVSSFVALGLEHGCDFTEAEAVCMMTGMDGVEGGSCVQQPVAVAATAGGGTYGFRDPETGARVGATLQVSQNIGARISSWRWSLNGW